MSKYSFEFKLKVVNEYLSGEFTSQSLAYKYGIASESLIRTWSYRFEQYGEEGLYRKITRNKYTGEFKLSVIKYRQINRSSYEETAAHFKISQPSTIAGWVSKYNEGGFEALDRPNGRPSILKKENSSISTEIIDESEKEELIRLREEVEYYKMKEEYEKKLAALVRQRELKTKKRRK